MDSDGAFGGKAVWQAVGGGNDTKFSDTDGWEGARTDNGDDDDDECNENDCSETGGEYE